MIPQISVLTLVATGYVAANKPLNSHNIEVVDPEAMSFLDGEITDNLTTSMQKGVDADGVAFEAVIRSAPTVTAKWLPFGSNRKTPPDVRRGERVALYRFGDADQYRWASLEYDENKRKLETVIWSISNTRDEGAKASENNTYYLCMSTHTKVLQLHTSMSDGEPFGYDFVFNTKEGSVQLTDTADNIFYLNSQENQLVLKTGDNAYINLQKENIDIKAPGNITIVADKNINVKSGGTSSWDSTGVYTVKAPSVKFITPMVAMSEQLATGGSALVGGSLTLKEGMTTGSGGSGGTIKLNGDIDSNGAAIFAKTGTFGGNVTAPNIR